MALLFLTFISMLIPRAHKLAVVSEEEEEQENKGKKMNQGKNDPKKTPKGCLNNYMNTRATWPPSQEAHATPFLHKINYG
jgi:hypothetical protein